MSDEGRDWEEAWKARQEALEAILGPSGDHVFHAIVPFSLGGGADVMMFPNHRGGTAYASAEMTGGSDQPPNAYWEEYEFVICLREHDSWAANLLTKLAPYSFEATVDPSETMDIGPALPQPTELTAFLFAEYGEFQLFGKKCGLLLCIGITPDELAACMEGREEQVLAHLKDSGIFPFTDLRRSSCLPPA